MAGLGGRWSGEGEALHVVVADRVARWKGGQAPGFEPPAVRIGFGGEEDASAADVVMLVLGCAGVPEMAGELMVGAAEELLALLGVLANEQDVGWVLSVAARTVTGGESPALSAASTARTTNGWVPSESFVVSTAMLPGLLLQGSVSV